jgi:hypothetical protein
MTFPDSQVILAFNREWLAFRADRRPVGWMLRQDTSVPWVRFHSLPDSKRYPENDLEEGLVLRRAWALGDAILGRGTDCWQVECRPKELDLPYWNVPVTGVASSTFAVEEDGGLWSSYVLPITWRPDALDATLLAIANEQTGPTLWINRGTGEIFAPYDGGFDLFPSSADEVARLKAEYKEWLSSHAEGL